MEIRSIMCTANLGCKLDLRTIAARIENAKYRPKVYNPVVLRVKEPVKCTATIFSSGKLVCTGTKSEDQAVHMTQFFSEKIRALGFPVMVLK